MHLCLGCIKSINLPVVSHMRQVQPHTRHWRIARHRVDWLIAEAFAHGNAPPQKLRSRVEQERKASNSQHAALLVCYKGRPVYYWNRQRAPYAHVQVVSLGDTQPLQLIHPAKASLWIWLPFVAGALCACYCKLG